MITKDSRIAMRCVDLCGCATAVGNSPSRRQLAPFSSEFPTDLDKVIVDEISLLFETTQQHFRPRYVVLVIAELSRTITRQPYKSSFGEHEACKMITNILALLYDVLILCGWYYLLLQNIA
jgi:hypothetical protein